MSVKQQILITVLAMSILKTKAALIYQAPGHVLVKMVIFLTERILVQFHVTVCTIFFRKHLPIQAKLICLPYQWDKPFIILGVLGDFQFSK